MSKVAVVNANSFGTYFPEFIDFLIQEVGEVTRFKFDQAISGQDLAEALSGYSYVISGTVPQFSEAFFKANTSVRYIARFGVGYNNIDVSAAQQYGVLVSNMPSYLEKEDVAEQAASLVLSLAKHITGGNQAVRNLEWNINRARFMGQRINGKTVGVIGLGHIGSTFARIMSRGYQCRVIAYDPYLSEVQCIERFAQKVDLLELIETADIISLHMNLTPENYHQIDASMLKRMKPTAILVNTARGELVDEQAVADALNSGKLFGYGADVIENEPPQKENPLLTARHCDLTPHLGTYNGECNREMCQCIVEDIRRVHTGHLPVNKLEG